MSLCGPFALSPALCAAAFAFGALACGQPSAPADPSPPPTAVRRDVDVDAPAPVASATRTRLPIDGRAFPNKVIALTWDDGPDANTLRLAKYLATQKVSGTFFVVNAWNHDTSAEPGLGRDVMKTGYEHLPILGELVALGHRVANHTLNHVLLSDAVASTVSAQLRENQYGIDPFLASEARFFRAPGGAFTSASSAAIDADPTLRDLVGPVGWDIDRKDWEGSLWCSSTRPALECERSPLAGHMRVKAHVVASRYVATIDAVGHGIVLLHDRVGHVGSDYALDVARAMIPDLLARGYVFAAPVLAFSPLTRRMDARVDDAVSGGLPLDLDAETVRIADVDGDGRADLCGEALGTSTFVCAPSFEHYGLATASAAANATPEHRPHAMFRDPRAWTRTLGAEIGASRDRHAVHLADIDGDGRADLCVRAATGISCALATETSGFGTFEPWSALRPGTGDEVAEFSDDEGWGSGDAYFKSVRFADVDGDGKADVCGRSPAGVVCARSLGTHFDHARLWLADMSDARGWLPSHYGTTMQLADVNGDGRADVCARSREGLVCGLSTGAAFARITRWSAGRDFADIDSAPWSPGWASSPSFFSTLRLGDLNGDGRADVCARTKVGIVCALSTGHGFTAATMWLSGAMTDAQGFGASPRSESIQLADINGDGRADICGDSKDGVVCGLAP